MLPQRPVSNLNLACALLGTQTPDPKALDQHARLAVHAHADFVIICALPNCKSRLPPTELHAMPEAVSPDPHAGHTQ